MKKIAIIIALLMISMSAFALDLSLYMGYTFMNDGTTLHAEDDFGFVIKEYVEYSNFNILMGDATEAEMIAAAGGVYPSDYVYYFNVDGNNTGENVYNPADGFYQIGIGGFVDNAPTWGSSETGASGNGTNAGGMFFFTYDKVHLAEIHYYGTNDSEYTQYLEFAGANHTYDYQDTPLLFGEAASNNPNPPTLVAPADGATNVGRSVFLDWEAPEGDIVPDGYRLTVNGEQIEPELTTTHFQPPFLNFGETYTWSVIAYANDPVRGLVEIPVTSRKANRVETRGDSDASPTWSFTVKDDPTPEDPADDPEEGDAQEGSGNGNPAAPADPIDVPVPPMGDADGNYVQPGVTIEPNPEEGGIDIVVSVTVNNQNPNVPVPENVSLSYNIEITGNTQDVVTIVLSYQGMDPAPTEIIYFNGIGWEPVNPVQWDQPSAGFATFDWTVPSGRAATEFVLNKGGDSTLPVELASFTVVQTTDLFAELNWVTHSETELSGFNLYRNSEEHFASAFKLNSDYIAPTNTSQETIYSYIDNTVEPGNQYYYWLESVDNDGSSNTHPPVRIQIDEQGAEEPDIFKTYLGQAYPNPFNPSTNIRFSVKNEEVGTLEIYNAKGQLVKTYGTFTAGEHIIEWQGKDDTNRPVSSGIYFYRLKTDSSYNVHKMLLLK